MYSDCHRKAIELLPFASSELLPEKERKRALNGVTTPSSKPQTLEAEYREPPIDPVAC